MNGQPLTIEHKFVYCPHCQKSMRRRVNMSGMVKCENCPMWFDILEQPVFTKSQVENKGD